MEKYVSTSLFKIVFDCLAIFVCANVYILYFNAHTCKSNSLMDFLINRLGLHNRLLVSPQNVFVCSGYRVT